VAIGRLVRSRRARAIVGWILIGLTALGAIESVLTGSLLWGLFSSVVVVVAALPALTTRDWTAMVSWVLLSVAAGAVGARAVGLYSNVAGYVAIVTLALVVVAELDAFTAVEFSRWFAVSFGAMMALALQSLWIIAQFYSDVLLGTDFLSTQTELQEDIVIVTVVALVEGGAFYWLFTRFRAAGTRLSGYPST
jgi:hypothetical protein